MAAALEAAGISYVRTDKGGPYPRNELTRWLERAAQWVTGGWRIREPRFEQILESWLRLLPRGGERDAVLERQQIAQFLWSSRDTKMSVVQWLDALEAQVNDHLARIRGSWPDLASGYDSLRNAVDSDGGALAGIDVVRLARAGGDPESVNLTTMHGSKGREFEAVVMIHMDQGHVPHWMAEPGTGGYRESRRLFYVGLTRAKQHVAFTWSGSGPISGAACFKMASLRF
jgi:DNA helicase-2/ATP-dependent DNA helicase PcrA